MTYYIESTSHSAQQINNQHSEETDVKDAMRRKDLQAAPALRHPHQV